MFFLHIRRVEDFAIPIAVLLVACGSIWLVWKRRKMVRILVAIISSPVALLAALFVFLQVMSLGCESDSAPIYSPDHQKLLRVVDWDAGATGGSASVELLTHHGLVSNDIYTGNWKSVRSGDIRWLDDSHIEIHHDSYKYFHCSSTSTVHVECMP